MSVTIHEGDALTALRTLPAGLARCCVTSPPYWGGLRDYGHAGQLGAERQPADYVAALVEVFAEVRRVLTDDGSLWLNLGDVYAAGGKGGGGRAAGRACWSSVRERKGYRMPPAGFKMKDLTLVAFAVADALRRDGWYLRSTVVWRKASAVEPMRADRPAVSHEYVFLLTKSRRSATQDPGEHWWGHTVWDIPHGPASGHSAPMPEELARRCVVASSRVGDTVLDPFGGAGTTGLLAQRNDRHAVLIELNPDSAAMARVRLRADEPPLFAVHAINCDMDEDCRCGT
jgi:site-specific DNA-methyltransferase (cytosine-N4-specific)